MRTKIFIIFLIFLFLLIKTKGLNSFTQYELPINYSISSIKYIPGVKILAVALNTSGIDFYDVIGTSIIYNRNIITAGRVNSMVTAVNNSRLIYTEDYQVNMIDFNSKNQTYSAQIGQKIHQIFPNGTSIMVQTQSTYLTYVCTLGGSLISFTCTQTSLPFTGLATYFMKPNSHDDRQTAIAYQGLSKSMDIRVDNTYNPYTVKSNITDIVYYSNIYQALIMTNTQSVYRTSVPTYGSYQNCRQMDLNVNIFKESVIDRQQQVFFYITETGQVKGRNVQDLRLAYYIPIINSLELQRLESNQDILIRTRDDRLFFIWTISYDNTNTIFENLLLCPDQSGIYTTPQGSTTTTNSTTSGSNNTTTSTSTNTTQPSTTTNTTNTTTNSSNTTTLTNSTNNLTNSTTSTNTTTVSETNTTTATSPNNFTITNDTTLITNNSNTTTNTTNTTIINNTNNTTVIIIDNFNQTLTNNQSSLVKEKQPIFYCQLNCQLCQNQLLCIKCKQGYQLTQKGTCYASQSIDMFSTIISTPYCGIVMNFILMDFMEQFWFFQHHNFNYTHNIARIFSLVGSLNRNKIVPPVFKYLIKDTLSNVNTRTISSSNFISYTPITFQKAQNTDVNFISNVSGMFIWAYSLILFMFIFTDYGHKILSKVFGSYLLLKFSTKPILLFLLFSPFIQYISFHSFCQLKLFFSFNFADKFNLVSTVCFLGMTIFFTFAGFPIFYYLNSVKRAKLIYSQQNTLKGYIKSFFLWSGKLLYLGFINGYVEIFIIQCANLLVLYAIQIWLLRKQISIKQKGNLIRAPFFFKLIIKILSFAFVLCSLLLSLNIFQKSMLEPNQQISIVCIWTWALAQILFKIVQILLISIKTVKSKIFNFFTQIPQNKNSQRFSVYSDNKTSKRVQKIKKNTTINISDILDDKTFQQKTIKTAFGQKSQIHTKIKLTKFKLKTKRVGFPIKQFQQKVM